MFGRALDEMMALECRLGGRYVPIMVHKCAQFIREHGVCALVVCVLYVQCVQCVCGWEGGLGGRVDLVGGLTW